MRLRTLKTVNLIAGLAVKKCVALPENRLVCKLQQMLCFGEYELHAFNFHSTCDARRQTCFYRRLKSVLVLNVTISDQFTWRILDRKTLMFWFSLSATEKKYARTNVLKYSFFHRITDQWNQLPLDTRVSDNVNNFKSKFWFLSSFYISVFSETTASRSKYLFSLAVHPFTANCVRIISLAVHPFTCSRSNYFCSRSSAHSRPFKFFL